MKVDQALIGTAGVALVEATQSISLPASIDTSEVIKIVIQLVIGVATLIGLFKKKIPQNIN
jgi:hypothetical protein